MNSLTVFLIPDFNQARNDLGYDEHDDYDTDDILYHQGYNMQEMEIKPGEKFTIEDVWQSGNLQCNGRMIKLIAKSYWDEDVEDNEQITLNVGQYLFHQDGKTIERLDETNWSNAFLM